MSFGEKLTKLRKEKGMSQEDLASNLNVSRQAVSKWESNSSYPETDKIVAICKLFNCSMDELIGLKEGKIKKENKLLNVFNKYFDMVIKGIKLFYCMTFKQKIKCLIEFAFYSLLLLCFFIVLNYIIIDIFIKLLYLLPNELLKILVQTIKGILNLIYLILGIYTIVKLYKIRYLDYYEETNEIEKQTREEVVVEESKKINIKEEKIIIRDPNTAFKPFSWIKKVCLIFIKTIALFIGMGFAMTFAILIACTIFIGYFISYGSLITYIVLGLCGAIIIMYIILEILIKFIFNMKQNPKRLFIMFVLSMLIVGISIGFFASELTTYTIIDKPDFSTIKHTETLEMKDNLIIDFINYYEAEVIYQNRDDVLIEYYSDDLNINNIETYYSDSITCKCNLNKYCFEYNEYGFYIEHNFSGKSFNDVINQILNHIKEKTIIVDDVLYNVKPKIYISKENYNKILQNIKKQDNLIFDCE